MTLKSSPLTQAAIRQMIKESVNDVVAERARHVNARNDARGSGSVRRQDVVPVVRECTFVGFMKCDPITFHGTEGAVELRRWFEKTKSVFGISECAKGRKVKFAGATLQGPALTWFNELALMCSRMVELERVKVDAYIQGLTDNIKGEVTSSRPANLNEAVRMAHKLMDQKSQDRDERILEGKKQKWESLQSRNSSGKGNHKDNSHQTLQNSQKQGNARAMVTAPTDGKIVVKNINEELSEFINSPSWNCPTFYNDDDEYTIIYRKHKEITPDLPIEEPDNSLSMGDKHLNTISETEKSSVENLVPIPSEFKGIFEDICDMLSCDYFDTECGFINSLLSRDILITSPKIDFLPEEFNPFIPFVLEYPSSSPIPVVDSAFLIEEVDTFLVPDDSIPPGIESDFDSEEDIIFLDNLLNEIISSEYERFTFDIEPDAPVINNFDELNKDECFDPGGGEIDVSQNIKDDDSFAFVIRTFLPYRTYPEDSPLLLSTRSEDTIFDPGIST
ncbi:hypothetical protein Tco_0444586 [Tanacetum coccineum]